jgi:hypothetical protein
MTIEISKTYGFCYNWTLKAYGKSFYLGQDVKFCHRILGCDPSYIVQQIGSNDLGKESTKKKLAKFNMEPWSLCAE